MKALTAKQRVKVNAALSMIHSHGLNAQAVSERARMFITMGHDPRSSFEEALNEFADRNPSLAPALGSITRLVEHSSPNTVAQYDQALSHYIATGDETAIDALGPMIAADSVALAKHEGKLTDGSITAANVEAALGLSVAPEAVQAAAQFVAPTKAASASVGFADVPAPKTGFNSSQVSPLPGGYVGKRAQWEATPDLSSSGPSRTLLSGHVIATASEG
jgi:hypothetical protein